jgi:hypothetical protein
VDMKRPMGRVEAWMIRHHLDYVPGDPGARGLTLHSPDKIVKAKRLRQELGRGFLAREVTRRAPGVETFDEPRLSAGRRRSRRDRVIYGKAMISA